MKGTNLKALENNNRIKKKYLPRLFWFKNAAIYPPSIFIFFALFGLVYLLNYDMLVSIYAIPFVVLFFLATIWLKSTKKYILNKLFSNEDLFKACLAAPIEIKDNIIVAIFTTDSTRHNKYFILDLAKKAQENNILDDYLYIDVRKQKKNKPFSLISENYSLLDNVYIVYVNKSDIIKERFGYDNKDVFPVFYLDKNHITVIKSRDINKL